MTNNASFLVWVIAFLILSMTACEFTGTEAAAGGVDEFGASGCNLDTAIVPSAITDVEAGDELALQANTVSGDIEYVWSVAPSRFADHIINEPEPHKIRFSVPSYTGTITITLNITVKECEETAILTLNNIILPTETPAPAESAESANTPTPMPTDTPTTVPSATPTSADTAVPANTPPPTSPPMPTTTPRPSVPEIIVVEARPGGAIYIVWSYEGQLNSSQNFAVRFWSEEDPSADARYSITWTKDLSYQFDVDYTRFPPGTYYVNIAVMEGSSDGFHYAVAESENVRIFVDRIEPTQSPGQINTP